MEWNIKHHLPQPPPPPKSPPRCQLQQPINSHHYLFHVHLHLQDCNTANHVVFYHLSAKDVIQQSLCPPGEESWCFVQRPEALGKKPEPRCTKKLSNIPGEQLELVKGIHKDLANPALLQKCLSGHIQNPNESLHSKVWRKVSKDKYAGLHRTRFVSQMTIWEHNFGYSEFNLLQCIGFGVLSHECPPPSVRDAHSLCQPLGQLWVLLCAGNLLQVGLCNSWLKHCLTAQPGCISCFHHSLGILAIPRAVSRLATAPAASLEDTICILHGWSNCFFQWSTLPHSQVGSSEPFRGLFPLVVCLASLCPLGSDMMRQDISAPCITGQDQPQNAGCGPHKSLHHRGSGMNVSAFTSMMVLNLITCCCPSNITLYFRSPVSFGTLQLPWAARF
ncbi:hypothetical protein O3P69_006207 [Scylla paramamosain]|uniref:Uncharacterized protein n=1 Tax=Scylla paramamosain TaxID=85552 RepID=A0AAW0U7B8_SCYPA